MSWSKRTTKTYVILKLTTETLTNSQSNQNSCLLAIFFTCWLLISAMLKLMAHLVKFRACRPKRLFKATYVDEACPSSHWDCRIDTSEVRWNCDNRDKPSVVQRHQFHQKRGWLSVSINLQWAKIYTPLSSISPPWRLRRPNQYPNLDRLGHTRPPITLLWSNSTNFRKRPTSGHFQILVLKKLTTDMKSLISCFENDAT